MSRTNETEHVFSALPLHGRFVLARDRVPELQGRQPASPPLPRVGRDPACVGWPLAAWHTQMRQASPWGLGKGREPQGHTALPSHPASRSQPPPPPAAAPQPHQHPVGRRSSKASCWKRKFDSTWFTFISLPPRGLRTRQNSSVSGRPCRGQCGDRVGPMQLAPTPGARVRALGPDTLGVNLDPSAYSESLGQFLSLEPAASWVKDCSGGKRGKAPINGRHHGY